MNKEPEAVIALRAAADLLVPGMKLQKYSEPAVREAFRLLYASNPSLVKWVFTDLAEIVKEVF